ncbi:MAG: DedA family protein [Bacteroidota bacterium]
MVVVGAALISAGSGDVSFAGVLLITSFGSSLGFMLMYYMGMLFGEKILRSGKLKFISQESIDKTDKWFTRYGFKLIIANRFLPGTRSVISFFAGISELAPLRTFIYATVSAFAWNVIIIYMGSSLGNNIEIIDKYLSLYGNIMIAVTGVVIVFFGARYLILKNKEKKN